MSRYSLFEALKHNPMFAHLDAYAFQIVENYLSFRALDPMEVLFHEGERGDFVAVVVAGRLEIIKKVRHASPYNPNSSTGDENSNSDNNNTDSSLSSTSNNSSLDSSSDTASNHVTYKFTTPQTSAPHQNSSNTNLVYKNEPYVLNLDNTMTTHLATMKSGDSIGEMSIIDELARSATVRALKTSGIVVLPKKDFDLILEDHPRIGINMLKGIATMLSINLRRTSATLSKKDTPTDNQ